MKRDNNSSYVKEKAAELHKLLPTKLKKSSYKMSREKEIYVRGVVRGYCWGIDDARKIVKDWLKELKNKEILKKKK